MQQEDDEPPERRELDAERRQARVDEEARERARDRLDHEIAADRRRDLGHLAVEQRRIAEGLADLARDARRLEQDEEDREEDQEGVVHERAEAAGELARDAHRRLGVEGIGFLGRRPEIDPEGGELPDHAGGSRREAGLIRRQHAREIVDRAREQATEEGADPEQAGEHDQERDRIRDAAIVEPEERRCTQERDEAREQERNEDSDSPPCSPATITTTDAIASSAFSVLFGWAVDRSGDTPQACRSRAGTDRGQRAESAC